MVFRKLLQQGFERFAIAQMRETAPMRENGVLAHELDETQRDLAALRLFLEVPRAKVYEEEKGKEIKKDDRWWIFSKYLANRPKWSAFNNMYLPSAARHNRGDVVAELIARAKVYEEEKGNAGGNADLVSAILEGVRSKPDTDPNVFRDFVDYVCHAVVFARNEDIALRLLTNMDVIRILKTNSGDWRIINIGQILMI